MEKEKSRKLLARLVISEGLRLHWHAPNRRQPAAVCPSSTFTF
ncbi:uncharacterized protein G2W53_024334 [Senna tora]|uniref:Uncharacterized protein n=1 Tax=Senna tora TaxID=362788 RepID=A0A834TJY8_9FABA|nr:uncharacterized protein G2W53_024334 [Senna tora]